MSLEAPRGRAAEAGPTSGPDPGRPSFKRLVADHAKLEIGEFDIHRRSEMETRGRTAPHYIMSYMKEGTSVVRVGSVERIVREGEIVVIPPGVCHDHLMGSSRKTTFLWWNFTLTMGGNLDILRFIREPVAFPLSDRDGFETQFATYLALHDEQDKTLARQLLRRAKALEIMSYLLSHTSVLNYIDDRFADIPDDFIAMLEDVVSDPSRFRRLNDLASKYDYHPTYLSGRFRHFFGVTPSRLARNCLFERAVILIRSRDINMEDIAYELGFSELSSFTRFFKSMAGLSPGAWRKDAGRTIA